MPRASRRCEPQLLRRLDDDHRAVLAGRASTRRAAARRGRRCRPRGAARDLPQELLADRRVRDRLQPLRVVGARTRSRPAPPVERAIGREDLGPEAFDELRQRRRPRLHHLPGDQVGVDDDRAPLREHLGDGRLARPDPARSPTISTARESTRAPASLYVELGGCPHTTPSAPHSPLCALGITWIVFPRQGGKACTRSTSACVNSSVAPHAGGGGRRGLPARPGRRRHSSSCPDRGARRRGVVVFVNPSVAATSRAASARLVAVVGSHVRIARDEPRTQEQPLPGRDVPARSDAGRTCRLARCHVPGTLIAR